MKIRWIIEAIVFIALIAAFAFFRDAYSGYFSAEAAIQQFNSSWDSLAPLVAYQWAYRGFGAAAVLFAIGVGAFEIGSFANNKETKNEEA